MSLTLSPCEPQELQRQKSEYEAKKAAAAELRRQIEQEDEERRTRERQKASRSLQEEEEDAAGREREREERRRAAVRVQEEQKAVMERQREGARREGRCRTASSSTPDESRSVGHLSCHVIRLNLRIKGTLTLRQSQFSSYQSRKTYKWGHLVNKVTLGQLQHSNREVELH